MIATSHLFRPLGRELVALLQGLTPKDWLRPTSAAEWSVKDVAAHLLDVDLRRLSAQRDGHIPTPSQPLASNADLVEYLNSLNRTWVEAARRLSAQVLAEELQLSSERVADLFEMSDPMAPATFPVAWAGEESSRAWFDIAREYTERWHHQDQIRAAVGAPPLADRRWLLPVLETSLLALPHAFRDVDAPEGACVVIRVAGDSGGEWTLRRRDSWLIESGSVTTPICTLSASDLALCRLLLHRLPADEAARSVRAEGRAEFLAALLNARAVMV